MSRATYFFFSLLLFDVVPANQDARNSVAPVPDICIPFAGARRFPGLINCTSVDFFHPWPRQALISVAARFLEDVELGDPLVKESLALHMAEEHLSVTKVGWVSVFVAKQLALLRHSFTDLKCNCSVLCEPNFDHVRTTIRQIEK